MVHDKTNKRIASATNRRERARLIAGCGPGLDALDRFLKAKILRAVKPAENGSAETTPVQTERGA